MKFFRKLIPVGVLMFLGCGGVASDNAENFSLNESGAGTTCWDCSSGSCVQVASGSPSATVCTENDAATSSISEQDFALNRSDQSDASSKNKGNGSDNSKSCWLLWIHSAGCGPCVLLEPRLNAGISQVANSVYISAATEYTDRPPYVIRVDDTLSINVTQYPRVIGLWRDRYNVVRVFWDKTGFDPNNNFATGPNDLNPNYPLYPAAPPENPGPSAFANALLANCPLRYDRWKGT